MPETVYHISAKYLGKKPILAPKIPVSAADGELEVPRICVCRDVTGCYLSCRDDMTLFHGTPQYHVYRAVVDRTEKAHKSVADREWIRERWLTVPTQFEHLGKMPKLRFPEIRSWHSNAYRTRIMREWIEGTFISLMWTRTH